MEKRLFSFLNKIDSSKTYRIITAILFPVLIIAFSYCKVNKGLDITDSAYSCTNFLFLDKLDSMWFFSTLYANLLGGFFVHLPGGPTFLWLNIYTGLIKLLLALFAYFFFVYGVKINRLFAFVGVMVSIALCWCPTTILYNYLTYLLFFLGAAFMYGGLVSKDKKLLVIAGFFLGSNLFVRFPNLIEAGLILALWLYSIIKKEKFSECVSKTLFCILGYVIAFIPGAIIIACTRGISEYVKGITELFSMTSESTGYSSVAMIIGIIRQYIETTKWLIPVCLVVLVCALIFRVLPEKLFAVKSFLSVIISVMAVFLMYRRGLFRLNFHWFEPVYRYGALVLMLSMIVFVASIFSKKISAEDKLLAAEALMIIFITPIGSNNDIYSNLNNLFWVLPVFMYLTMKVGANSQAGKGAIVSVGTVSLIWFVLCMGFGVTYVFRDGLDGKMDTKVTGNEVCVGMNTTAHNADNLSALSVLWTENDLRNTEVLLYGDVSGLGFYLNTKVAISTAWPSLDSFSVGKFESDIMGLESRVATEGVAVTVVIDEATKNALEGDDKNKKQEILKNFLDKYGYEVLYSNDVLTVLTKR